MLFKVRSIFCVDSIYCNKERITIRYNALYSGKDFAHAKDMKAKSTQNTLSNIYKNVRIE